VVRKLTWVFSAYVGDTKWLHGLDLSLRTTSAQKNRTWTGRAGARVRLCVGSQRTFKPGKKSWTALRCRASVAQGL
jgi:hypothetical protein